MDVSTRQQTISVCQNIANRVSTVKVGLELIYSQGLGILDTVKSFGYNIMLDSKLLDIPNTVSGACRAIAQIKPFAVTAHTLGGPRMISDAKAALDDASREDDQIAPMLFGVTVLTSLDDSDLRQMGIDKSYMEVVDSLGEDVPGRRDRRNSMLSRRGCRPQEKIRG
ncbi:MAG: orotidine 5'-phosphate decarboxylase / HUMPS family protein [Actinomycetota bacterium]|nr:orotidine 5'-phosphate decarboxylase / HUMPS family protein [Actinomycetota bacterium]